MFPLTVGQSSIWIAQALNLENPAYNVGECIEIYGDLDCETFERALRAAIDASDSLSLAFVETEDGPRQFFAPDREWALEFVDLSATPDPQEMSGAWMRADMARPLDLSNARPFRFALLRLSAQKHRFYAVNHHLVNDGFGASLLLGRIAETYKHLLTGAEARQRPVRSFLDILARETDYRSSSQFARDREYWLNQLQDRPKPLQGSAGAQPSEAVELATGFISRAIDLAALGRRYGASALAVFVAATIAYVYRQTNETDIVVGLQVSARLGEGMRDAVGYVTNIVPLRIGLEPTWSFARLVEVVSPKLREAMRHQRYRVEDLIRDLGIPPGAPDLFNLVINFIPIDETIAFDALPVRRLPLGNWSVPDLQIAYYDGSEQEGRRLDVVANAGRYDAALVRLYAVRFCQLLEACAAAPETPCKDIPRMPETERDRVLSTFNRAKAEIDADGFVHRCVERQACDAPDRLALKFRSGEISYGQLNRKANRLARLLRENGVGPDTLVVLCVERPIEMVLGVLATLKAGGAYVPIDPDQPTERTTMILRDMAARFVLTTPKASLRVRESLAKVIVLDHEQEIFAHASDGDLDPFEFGLTPANLAYVIYTSGSTGLPKGVMIEHRALFNRLDWMQRAYRLDQNDRVLQKNPYTFDVSVWEFLWPLSVGATLVLAEPDERLDPEKLARTIVQEGVTTVHFVPSLLASFLNDRSAETCKSLTRIVCSGEELPARLADDCMKVLPNATLYNLYGPTEAAIDVTHWTCAPDARLSRVPIGRPIDNVQIYILDEAREPVAIGAVGEIYIAGIGLARGYLNRPELTAELFVRDPFAGDPAARMYKTGDLGLWRPDGAIEYHGRYDNQVKIWGFRIELGEIEAQLKLTPGVRDAAVVVQDLATGERRLMAFFVAEPGALADADPNAGATLRRQLSHRLPEQMMPSAFYPLEALPLTANGKLDRRALLHLCAALSADAPAEAQAPSTPTELVLTEIWRDLLGAADFDRRDDFFELGGHSLLVTRVRSRIRLRLGVDLPLKLLFEKRVLADLAQAVDDLGAAKNRDRQRIEPSLESDNYLLSHSQQRMWLNQSLEPETTAYNLTGAVKLRGALNVAALSQAFDELRRRHSSLRSVYLDAPDGVIQRVLAFRSERLEATDLRARGAGAPAEALRLAEKDAQTPFDLEAGPVMRILLFQIGENEHLLYVALHHISGDQWSFAVLSRELSEVYNALCEGRPPVLEPLPIQYGDYATWQRSEQQVARAREQLEYWRRKLEGLPALDMPTDFPRPRLRTSSGSLVQVQLPAELLNRLDQFSRREGATLFMTMLAAFAILLSRLTGQTDFAVGAPIANRTLVETEPLVGTFVNTLVMRLDLSGRPTFREFLVRVRETAMEAYSHQDASFDELVQAIARPRDDGRPPLVQVMFNMLNAPLLATSLNQLAWDEVIVDRRGAQFEISVSVDPQVSNAIVFEYNASLFKRTSIERLAAQYVQLLESAVADPKTPVARLNLLPVSEAKLLTETWNATFAPRGPELTFIRMFERQAAAQPDAEALRFNEEAVSYGELNRLAELIAGHLRGRGVRPGVGVGICLKRTPLLLAALLGVQKAGGHYIPLDPAAPRKRLEFMLEDSGLSVLIAQDAAIQALASSHVARLDPQTFSEPATGTEFGGEAGEQDLAYIIYTSGSTGRPKGVRVTQRGLANFLDAMRRRPGMEAQDSIVAITTISFDIAGLELYLPLCVGARIVLAPAEVAADGDALSRLLDESGATVLQGTPATWRMLLDAGWTGASSLRAFCGGEALSADLARDLMPKVKELWNLYGPTETTIWSTVARVEADGPISIGAPIDNTSIYIADSEGGICPIGAAGEIWIAGDGVADGYQNRPDLTRERFQQDPFVEGVDRRLYKTGDLGVRGDDGRLYHYGRLDNQLKVQGFRVEAEEVEALLRGHPAIRDAVVAARNVGEGDTRLVAYLIANGDRLPTSSEMRAHLRESAPDYMTPSIFVEIDKLPLTPSGKIDRNALPDPFASSFSPASAYEAPATNAEKLIADIWRQVLKVQKVGVNDNFFELGGHSLLALRVAALVKTSTGWRMDPRTLYFQTLRQVAAQSDASESRGQIL